MATITGYTAEHMQEIVDKLYASGAIDLSGHLVFTTNDGSTVDVGQVKGDKGDPAVYQIGSFANVAVDNYIRLATLDGQDANTGASMEFFISNLGNIGVQSRGTLLVHATQRGADQINVKAWSWGLDTASAGAIVLYTRKLGPYLYEIWAKIAAYSAGVSVNLIGNWRGVLNLDTKQSAAPSGLSIAPYEPGGSSAASYTLPGIIEIATNPEALAGTDQTRAITPSSLQYVIGETFVPALLDPTYVGPGPARVTFLDGSLSGGSLSTQAYQWLGKYEPWGNRVVTMVRDGSTWAILGHSGEEGRGGKVELFGKNNWVPYDDFAVIPQTRYAMPKAQRLPSGIVVLSGLIGYGTTTAGTPILTLPPAYRPDTDMIFPVNNGDTAKTVIIKAATGDIVPEGGNWVNSYMSLDGIAYPAAGVASWTVVPTADFRNGWVDYNNAAFGKVRYWKDPYGFVWWAGMVANGTMTDSTPICVIPSSIAPDLPTHNKAGSWSTFGLVGFLPAASGSTLVVKANTANNGWISLAGVVLVTPEALANTSNRWIDLKLANGWTRYTTGYPPPQVVRREDGLGMSRGLIKGGTAAPVKFGQLPRQLMNTNQAILFGASNAGFARLDWWSMNDAQHDARSSMYLQSGAIGWLSIDNQMWMVGD